MVRISEQHIGKIIKEARERIQLTQAQLAQKVGKKRSYISKIESEQGNNIKVQTLIEIIENGLEGKVEISFKEKE